MRKFTFKIREIRTFEVGIEADSLEDALQVISDGDLYCYQPTESEFSVLELQNVEDICPSVKRSES